MVDFKSYGLADWLKVIANIAASAAVGYQTGDIAGLAVAVVVNLAALLQAKPGTIAIPK